MKKQDLFVLCQLRFPVKANFLSIMIHVGRFCVLLSKKYYGDLTVLLKN